MRILALSHAWLGANDLSFVSAFRRAGHSVTVVSDDVYYPTGWKHPALRALRRLIGHLAVADYNAEVVRQAQSLRPDLLFVFKGSFVKAETIEAVRRTGAVAIDFYPDIGFEEHGPEVYAVLKRCDWVFTTKSFHLDQARGSDLQRLSFVPHGFDPEVHAPVPLDGIDREKYACDAAFIGTWTKKKEDLLRALAGALPDLRLRIWGNGWGTAAPGLEREIMGGAVTGREYAKAIAAADVCIALLIEPRLGMPLGDQTTARTFEIPAVGAFMLHERTAEAQGYFAEGIDCAMFEGAEELAAKVAYYLAHPEERRRIAEAGHRRCLSSGYSVDDRVATILAKVEEIRAAGRS